MREATKASPVVLTTTRTRLVALSTAFAEALARYRDRNREHFGHASPPVPTGAALIEWARASSSDAEREWEQEAAFRFVVLGREGGNDHLLGHVAFTQIARGPFQACYLGFGLDHAEVGRGLMREALEAAIDFAFRTKRLHRIMANHLPTNERSARTLRSVGFLPEGYARDYLFLSGAWRDHVLTALTNPQLERP